ncbi:hypothetical protein KLP40_19665 [Hymenobacter sp. NST-14]|uniref:hypothetical protein n=1 Tax=Hymenobacter piscis TaxID=2839984 RepID=UPI001C026692|nr:hypothetical protein [Hymenobacter piscis]MBT9395393.1 hypothetical protein [Hymenobacter piscis]
MNNLTERFNWDTKSRQVRFQDATEPATDNFAVSAKGVALFYALWLPPTLWSYAPDAAYLFPFGQLRLQPAWQQLQP